MNKGYQGEVNRTLNFAKSLLATIDFNQAFAEAEATIAERYGLFTRPAGSVGAQLVPFDFIADMYRVFSKIPLDVRRRPEKLLAAIEAIMPFTIWLGKPKLKVRWDAYDLYSYGSFSIIKILKNSIGLLLNRFVTLQRNKVSRCRFSLKATGPAL